MRIFDFLAIMNPSIDPKETKVHLATKGSSEHPLDLYHIGEFEEWQCWQKRKNFERKFVLSLVELRDQDRWLFAGVYYSSGAQGRKEKGYYYYELTDQMQRNEWAARCNIPDLVVSRTRIGVIKFFSVRFTKTAHW